MTLTMAKSLRRTTLLRVVNITLAREVYLILVLTKVSMYPNASFLENVFLVGRLAIEK